MRVALCMVVGGCSWASMPKPVRHGAEPVPCRESSAPTADVAGAIVFGAIAAIGTAVAVAHADDGDSLDPKPERDGEVGLGVAVAAMIPVMLYAASARDGYGERSQCGVLDQAAAKPDRDRIYIRGGYGVAPGGAGADIRNGPTIGFGLRQRRGPWLFDESVLNTLIWNRQGNAAATAVGLLRIVADYSIVEAATSRMYLGAGASIGRSVIHVTEAGEEETSAYGAQIDAVAGAQLFEDTSTPVFFEASFVAPTYRVENILGARWSPTVQIATGIGF